MQQRKSLSQTLTSLTNDGVLTKEQADEILEAPRWAFSPRELLSYLAALIVTVGVLRTVAAALTDVSEATVAVLLYLLTAITTAGAFALQNKNEMKSRIAEILELAAVLSFAIATGIVCDIAGLEMKWVVAGLGLAAVVWGFYRATKSIMAGAVLMSAGIPTFIVAFAAAIDESNQRVVGAALVVGGVFLIFTGMQKIGFSLAPRAAGSLYVIIGAFILSSELDASGRAIPLIVGAALFAVGTNRIAPEMLLAGAFCVLAGIMEIVFETINDEILQGVAIIASGLLVLLVLGVQLRRTVSRSKTETPAA